MIAVGGAPIYGSDAIAGTINVILKRNYQGVQLDAQYGITEYGDLPNYRFRGLVGHNFAGGRGNITFSGEYNRQPDGLLYTDRAITRPRRLLRPAASRIGLHNQLYTNEHFNILSEFGVPLVERLLPARPDSERDRGRLYRAVRSQPELPGRPGLCGSSLAANYPSQNALYCGGFGLCGNFTNAQGQALRFDRRGNLVPIDFGTRPGPNPLPLQFGSAGGNGLDLNRVSRTW